MWILWVVLGAAACVGAYLCMTAPGPDASAWLTKWKYAHRGLHDSDRPENTLSAFSAAIEAGYGIELDVHLTADGEIVVFHDSDLKRMTGIPGRPEKKKLSELRALRVGGTDEKIPLLSEVLDLTAGRVPLLIETKTSGRAGKLEKGVRALLRTYKGKTAVQSFSPFSICWFRKEAPAENRGQLSCSFTRFRGSVPRSFLFIVKHLLLNFLCRPNFISYGTDGLGNEVVRRLRRGGTPILAWTVRSAEEEARVAPLCDTIIFEGFRPRGWHHVREI